MKVTIVAADTRYLEHVREVIIEADSASAPDVPMIEAKRLQPGATHAAVERITVKGVANA